ncbi:MAG TPA: periplasmic heavy metal sensor [Thermoanaerobaculia bacterium]|nr:periplasmic heavy metal sensor [Thermoanaerobaculia bacterium]
MKRALICGLALLLPLLADAQELPPGKWWQRPEISKRLSLTDVQRDSLEAIFRETAPQLIDLKAQAEKRALELHEQLDKTTLNREAIERAAAAASQARARLFERELLMLVDMRAVLSDEQWSQFRRAVARHRAATHSAPAPPSRGRGKQRGNRP